MTIALLLAACAPTETDTGSPLACTDEVVPSVKVTVTSTDGREIKNLSIEYAVDGEAVGACQDDGNGSFDCGQDELGTFGITVSADRYTTAEREVVVESDGCHPVTQALDVALESRCTGDPVPAIVVILSAEEEGGTLENPNVQWRFGNTTMQFEDCEREDLTFNCGLDESGSISVNATSDGRGTMATTRDVVLDAEGCHPETQTFEWALAILPR